MDGRTHNQIAILSAPAITLLCSQVPDTYLIDGIFVSAISSILSSELADLDIETSGVARTIPLHTLFSKVSCLISITISLLLFLSYSIITESMLEPLFNFLTPQNILLVGITSGLYAILCCLFLFITSHREFTHSVCATILFCWFSFYPYRREQSVFIFCICLGLAVGYTSHIIADLFTKQGCALLYPFIQKRFSFCHKENKKALIECIFKKNYKYHPEGKGSVAILIILLYLICLYARFISDWMIP